ncbi:MAG: hypothetical protein IKH71_16805 [Oscillospiraceae bacterium]|nr:hypothetical protein [Oscillospiraceae bacterium]
MNKKTLAGLMALIITVCIAGCSAEQKSGNETAEKTEETTAVSETTEESVTEAPESETTVPETTVTTSEETTTPDITEITVTLEEQSGLMSGMAETMAPASDNNGVKFTVIQEDGNVVEVTDSEETLSALRELGDLVRVGEENFGFINIPVDWDYTARYELQGTEYIKYGNHEETDMFTLCKCPDTPALTIADECYESVEAAQALGYRIIQSQTTYMMGKKAYRLDYVTGENNPLRATFVVETGENECYLLQVMYTDPRVFKLVSTYDTDK